MCRYNFRWATPGMVAEFGFTKFQITGMLSAWSLAYGTGQLVNGLLTDRIGGKTAMLIGAVGTIVINLIFGFASFAGTFSTFSLIWLMNGYLQSFGAPGMIKMNAAWFNRTERGTFAGIFGFMIQLGQFAINNLAPIILAGFSVGTWVVAKGDWRWLFRIPPLIAATMAILLVLFVKETPEAGRLSRRGRARRPEDRRKSHGQSSRIFRHRSSRIRWSGFTRSPTPAPARCGTVPISSRFSIFPRS